MQWYLPSCPRCGAAAPPGKRYCQACGQDLQAPGYIAGQTRPRRPRRPLYAQWWLWLLVVFVLGFGALVWLAVVKLRAVLGLAPPQLLAGTQLSWRELRPPPDPNLPSLPMFNALQYYQVVLGDFDADGDEELLLSGGPGNPCLLEASGAGQRISTGNAYLPYVLLSWDYDGDGRDELVGDDYSTGGAQVLDLQGRQLKQLAGGGLQGAGKADFDADGRLDLALLNQQQTGIVVYQPGGTELWRLSAPANYYNPAFGDIDGDGKAEAVYYDNGTLRSFGMDQQEAQQAGWSGYYSPALVADLNGDGRGEVFASNSGYLDPASGQFVSFSYLSGGPGSYSNPLEQVLICHTRADGKLKLLTRGPGGYLNTPELYLFQPDGSCHYAESLGSSIEQLAVLHEKNGQQYIVVRTERKLLIYP